MGPRIATRCDYCGQEYLLRHDTGGHLWFCSAPRCQRAEEIARGGHGYSTAPRAAGK